MKLELTTLEQHPEFIDDIAQWYSTAWPDYFADRDAHSFVTGRAQSVMPLALLVLADHQAAGIVTLCERSDFGPSDLGPWVEGLFVAEQYRGQGIGQLLVVSASRVAWSLGHERIYAATDAAAVFVGVGWTPLDPDRSPGELGILTLGRPEDPPSLYDEIGGEDVVRALVDRFYDLMDSMPQAAEIRAMHARSLKSSRQKLFEFLSGWLGGPQLYVEKHGHPRLRARHLPFAIGTSARDQWLDCMNQALEDTVSNEEVRRQLAQSFSQIADHMRNKRQAP